jgi:hypothetical protein
MFVSSLIILYQKYLMQLLFYSFIQANIFRVVFISYLLMKCFGYFFKKILYVFKTWQLGHN